MRVENDHYHNYRCYRTITTITIVTATTPQNPHEHTSRRRYEIVCSTPIGLRATRAAPIAQRLPFEARLQRVLDIVRLRYGVNMAEASHSDLHDADSARAIVNDIVKRHSRIENQD